MAYRVVALEAYEAGLVEDLRDQTHVLDNQNTIARCNRDPCALLPSVLEGVQAEIGYPGDFFSGSINAEDPARLFRRVTPTPAC